MSGGKTEPMVSVIIPHYGGEEILQECLESLKNTVYEELEIIVVDNNSQDDSTNIINTKFTNVKLIQSEINRGFAGGCNLGAQYAKGEYLLILNNDKTPFNTPKSRPQIYVQITPVATNDIVNGVYNIVL